MGFTLGFLLVVGAGVAGFALGTYIAKKAGLYDGLAIISPEAKQRMERYFACIQAQLEAQGLTLNDWFSDPDGPQKISQELRDQIESTCSLTTPQKNRT